MSDDFHKKPFDQGTLTKLKLFELYTGEWLPVFLSRANSFCRAIHIFDFFAGPGSDLAGEPGSPIRILKTLTKFEALAGWSKVEKNLHFFDESSSKIAVLSKKIDELGLKLPGITLDVRSAPFAQAFGECHGILRNPNAAKLVFIDQTGVSQVTPDVFRSLVNAPMCDFMFFVSSSTLHRFKEDPNIFQKIETLEDHYQVHRAALRYYRGLLPAGKTYYLAPFSIKKGGNIYGVIFGSAHALGIDKFLQVAWKNDELRGEADFDIDRENLHPGDLQLPFRETRASKITVFEETLEALLRAGQIRKAQRYPFGRG